MAKCKECSRSYGFLELKTGVCKSCVNIEKPPCEGCGKNFDEHALTEGFCTPCWAIEQPRREQDRLERESRAKAVRHQATEENRRSQIIITTECAPAFGIEKRLDIITAECALGMNIFRDIFSGVRDIVGGRSGGTQNILRDARKTVLKELREEAFDLGANAVIATSFNYSEFSGGGKSMLFVVATGTAVVAEVDN
ncbi:MAG: YbjQ family protein [Porticoccaceae bacterium]|nr:YbjQ family protein [Porticoccaceae bacterium]